MKYLATILLIIAAKVSIAQTLYIDSIFSEVNKTTYSFSTYNNETLQFDYYIADNAQEQVPLLVFVHGGGFSYGVRDSEDIVSFATKIAQRGYAVASVSYRLTMKGIGFGCDVEASKKIATIDSASYDVCSAIKYILDNNKIFRIDQNKIILAGSSAGAETVLNMAYVYEDETLPSGFNYAGVISMAGAIISLDKINRNTAIPTQLFHGTADRLVPYNIAPHHYCNSNDKGYLMLYGSEPIAERLKGLGTSYYFYSIDGGSHGWANLPMTMCFDEIIDFLYHDIISINSIRQTYRTINDR
jgi:para-nitrobenzyl esterase